MSMIFANTVKEVSPQDNVVNFNTPKIEFSEVKSVPLNQMSIGIMEKEFLYSTSIERLQIKSIEDELGFTLVGARNAIELFPIGDRCFNPSPVNWMNPASTESSIVRVQNWWLDIVHVLSKTVPSLATTYFISLNEFFREEPNEIKIVRRELEKRLKKINPKKKSKNPDSFVEQVMWTDISKNLGRHYVTNFVMNPLTIDRMMSEQFHSETMIRGLADEILGEESIKGYPLGDKRFGQVGDAATVTSVIVSHYLFAMREGRDFNFDELIYSKTMKNHFDADVLEMIGFATNHSLKSSGI